MARKASIKALYGGVRNQEVKVVLKAGQFNTLTDAIQKTIELSTEQPSTSSAQVLKFNRGNNNNNYHGNNRNDLMQIILEEILTIIEDITAITITIARTIIATTITIATATITTTTAKIIITGKIITVSVGSTLQIQTIKLKTPYNNPSDKHKTET